MRKIWVRKLSSWEEEAEADREYWAQYSGDEKVALIETLKDEWERTMKRTRGQSDQAEFLQSLNRNGVVYLVIGAHAVAFHAKPRYTKDLDIFVECSQQNADRVARAIEEFGFGGIGISAADFEKPGNVVQLGVEPHRIDVTTSISGITFEEAWQQRVAGTLLDEPVQYLGREDLIRNKKATGRSIDSFDLEMLNKMK